MAVVQVLVKKGVLDAVDPEQEVLIDPGLRSSNGARLKPDAANVGNRFEVVEIFDNPSEEETFGTFRVRSNRTKVGSLQWSAEALYIPRGVQTTVGERGSLTPATNGIVKIKEIPSFLCVEKRKKSDTVTEEASHILVKSFPRNKEDADGSLELPETPMEGMRVTVVRVGSHELTVYSDTHNVNGCAPGEDGSMPSIIDAASMSFLFDGEGWWMV